MSGYAVCVKRHDLTPSDAHRQTAAGLFKAMADPTRLRLLVALMEDESTVGDLVGLSRRPQSTVSRHLAALRQAGLVSSRRDGPRVYYCVANLHVSAMLEQALGHADHLIHGIPHDDEGHA